MHRVEFLYADFDTPVSKHGCIVQVQYYSTMIDCIEFSMFALDWSLESGVYYHTTEDP